MFKSGAGLSMALCASTVRRMVSLTSQSPSRPLRLLTQTSASQGGSMQVSSDRGRGTVVAVLLPIKNAPSEQVMEGREEASSAPDQLIYLWGFQGIGLQRLAGAICAQLASEYQAVVTSLRVPELRHLCRHQPLQTCTRRLRWKSATTCYFQKVCDFTMLL